MFVYYIKEGWCNFPILSPPNRQTPGTHNAPAYFYHYYTVITATQQYYVQLHYVHADVGKELKNNILRRIIYTRRWIK